MAQPEEARDPSMEEILASIRKIIAEDNPEPPQAAPHLTVVSNESLSEEPQPAALTEADESLGERLARKAGAERDAKRPPISALKADAKGAAPTEEPIVASAGNDAVEPESTYAEAESAELDERAADADASLMERQEAPPAEVAAPQAVPKPPTSDARPSAALAVGEVRPSHEPGVIATAMAVGNPQPVQDGDRLLSPQAGQAVHSAFDQLASTIMNNQARTIEDLVKDMMRPMLQHWLDDNLPVLVERLVREEIERVSRGRR